MSGLLELVSKEGLLLNVSVRYWRAAKKLVASDIGLADEDINRDLVSLGHKKLLPKDALKNLALIEGRAHQLVEDSTFPFLGGIARFLPNAKLQQVISKLDDLKQEFTAEQSKFMDNYARLRAEALREWRISANKLTDDPQVLLANIEASFPQPEAMDRYFSFETSMFQIQAPESLTTSLVAPEVALARQRAAQAAKVRIEAGVDSFVQDCIATLREQTAQLCSEMLGSMSHSTEGVHQKTLNRLVKFIDRFKSLNFARDQELEQQLETARQQLLSRTAAEYRDSSHAQSQLRHGLEQLRGEAQRLASQDATELVQRFGQLGTRKFNLAA